MPISCFLYYFHLFFPPKSVFPKALVLVCFQYFINKFHSSSRAHPLFITVVTFCLSVLFYIRILLERLGQESTTYKSDIAPVTLITNPFWSIPSFRPSKRRINNLVSVRWWHFIFVTVNANIKNHWFFSAFKEANLSRFGEICRMRRWLPVFWEGVEKEV